VCIKARACQLGGFDEVQLVRLLDGLAARQGLDVGPLMIAFQVGAVWRTCATDVSRLFEGCALKKKKKKMGCVLYGLHDPYTHIHCVHTSTRCAISDKGMSAWRL
jgi:hypothetical protein